MKLKVMISVIAICILFQVSTFLAMAEGEALAIEETANDLFRLYNEAEVVNYNELQEEYFLVKSQYDNAVTDTYRAELFNEALNSVEEYFEAEELRIDCEIKELLDSNLKIKEGIKENIMGEWNYLTELYTMYKLNLSKVDGLLREKDKLVLVNSRSINYESLDILSKEINDLMSEYEEVTDVAILGDISNVRYPLGKDTVVTSKWGNRVDPMTGTSVRFHAGLDLRAAEGTEVQALFNGVVKDTGYGAAGGYYVKLDHGNGISTYYCHLSEIKCEEGQKVNQYDQIALSGNTGTRTTGPHLQLAVYINNNSVNPEILFTRE